MTAWRRRHQEKEPIYRERGPFSTHRGRHTFMSHALAGGRILTENRIASEHARKKVQWWWPETEKGTL
jgi:integrase